MKNCNPVTDQSVAIAVLAAGKGSRFGGGKLDADLGEKPVGKWITDSAELTCFDRFIIVTGKDRPDFSKGLVGWDQMTNQKADQGIGTSISMAVNTAHGSDRLVVVLADMPLVSSDHLRKLASGSGISFTAYPHGRFGVPAAFPSRSYSRLAALSGPNGAASIDLGEKVELLAPSNPDELCDVDTVSALEVLRTRLSR